MKFSVNKSTFMNVLTPAMGTVSNKNTITSIEGVLMETLDTGDIRISTFDMNKGVRAIFTPESIDRPGKFIVNAQRLYQTVRVLPDEIIEIDINDKLNCIISSGKSSFSMFATRGEDFPTLPDLTTDTGFSIPSNTLKKIISKVSHSIAVQDNRVSLTGAFFKIKNDELEVVSSDSYTFSKCNIKCPLESLTGNKIDYSFIIPGHALSELSKILPDEEDFLAEFYISRKHAIVKCDDITFFTRTIDSEYIDYKRVIPKDNGIAVSIDKDRLLSGLERANLIAEEKIQGSGKSYVKLKIEGNTLSLTSTSVNGNVSDEMDCIHTGDDIEIAFNCRYFINSVRVIDSNEIKITLKGSTLPMTLEPNEKDEKFESLYMIVPMRMREQ